jgi:hypothetical protein
LQRLDQNSIDLCVEGVLSTLLSLEANETITTRAVVFIQRNLKGLDGTTRLEHAIKFLVKDVGW